MGCFSRKFFIFLTACIILSGPALVSATDIRVDSTTATNYYEPSVASNRDGDFVVVWGTSDEKIVARIFNDTGTPLDPDFIITDNPYSYTGVAMDGAGNFVVVWSKYIAADDVDVYAQRYNNTGSPLGSEFQVNTFTAGSQTNPSVAMDADGDFVVTWSGPDQDGFLYSVYARRYDNTGSPIGNEFLVSDESNTSRPTVGMDSTGNFVISFHGRVNAAADYGIIARRYDFPLWFLEALQLS